MKQNTNRVMAAGVLATLIAVTLAAAQKQPTNEPDESNGPATDVVALPAEITKERLHMPDAETILRQTDHELNVVRQAVDSLNDAGHESAGQKVARALDHYDRASRKAVSAIEQVAPFLETAQEAIAGDGALAVSELATDAVRERVTAAMATAKNVVDARDDLAETLSAADPTGSNDTVRRAQEMVSEDDEEDSLWDKVLDVLEFLLRLIAFLWINWENGPDDTADDGFAATGDSAGFDSDAINLEAARNPKTAIGRPLRIFRDGAREVLELVEADGNSRCVSFAGDIDSTSWTEFRRMMQDAMAVDVESLRVDVVDDKTVYLKLRISLPDGTTGIVQWETDDSPPVLLAN